MARQTARLRLNSRPATAMPTRPGRLRLHSPTTCTAIPAASRRLPGDERRPGVDKRKPVAHCDRLSVLRRDCRRLISVTRKLVVPMTTETLRGRVALVTGGSRGIGAAIVRRLANAGVAVAINYRERADEANTLVKSIAGTGGRAIAIAADVSQSDAVAQMIQRANAE